MTRLDGRRAVAAIVVAGLCGIVVAGQGTRPATGQPSPGPALARAVFDLVALDASGQPVRDLTPEDLQVTIGGQRRAVRSLRFAFRGAGSERSARGGLTSSPSVSIPARVVVVMVDENAIRRGHEKAAASSAWRVIDSLTPTDVVGVIALPRPRDQTPLGVDRGTLRAALNAIVGRAGDDALAAAPTAPPSGDVVESQADVTGPEQVDRARKQQEAEAEQRRNGTDQAGRSGPSRSGTTTSPVLTAASSSLGQSFRALALALEQLRNVPGQKFVIYLTGGEGGRGVGLQSLEEDPGELIDAAAQARVNVHVVLSAESARMRVVSPLERLAGETGGTVTVLLAKKPQLGDLSQALASGYIVELEPSDTDRVGRVATLAVQTSRAGVKLVTASRWALRDDALPDPETPLPTSTDASAARSEPKPVSGRDEPAQDGEFDAVLARVSQYVDTYLAQFGSVVAEEDYYQTVRRGSTMVDAQRTKADVLLVRSANGWLPFRDVYEVNDKPVRDREARLKKLFLENPGQALTEGGRISDESARYNLGQVHRTINAPTVVLSFFQSSLLPSFTFKRHGTETIDGTPVWRIDYREVGRPTQIVHGTTGADMPSTGAIYVEPASGRVVRTVLQNGDARTVVEVVVKFGPNDSLGLWTPTQMTERYWSPNARGDTISCNATYSSFRRFQVETSESIGPPR